MKRIYSGVEVTYQNETDYNQTNVVYLITFPNGKKYVGSTTKVLTRRMSIGCATAINKHGKYESIVFTPIREFKEYNVKVLDSESDKYKLRRLEEFYTIEYRTNEAEYGYNQFVGDLMDDTAKLKQIKLQGTPITDDFDNIFLSMQQAAHFYGMKRGTTISKLVRTGKIYTKGNTRFYLLKTTE